MRKLVTAYKHFLELIIKKITETKTNFFFLTNYLLLYSIASRKKTMYNFSMGKDPYSYSIEQEEEDEEPLWATKAVKPKGVGLGLGKGKTFSSGIGFSMTS